MPEIVNTYELENPFVLVPMGRGEFYKEQVEVFKKYGKSTRAVETVNILIFNSHGEVIIQKRSFEKNHNPGLLDKSVGGHIQNGDTADYTVMVETIQELQTPAVVLKNEVDFEKTYKILQTYLETIAIVEFMKTELVNSIHIIDGQKIKIANKVNFYLAVYDGRMRPADREAKGILHYSLPELKKEMTDSPEIFTESLHFLMREHEDVIIKFVEYITEVNRMHILN